MDKTNDSSQWLAKATEEFVKAVGAKVEVPSSSTSMAIIECLQKFPATSK